MFNLSQMRTDDGKALSWAEIDLAPEGPGVYAWYSRLIISKADIEQVIKSVNAAKASGGTDPKEIVETALDRFVFSPYREAPYEVQLRGQLKPKYSGQVLHEPTKSSSLVGRLIDQPERIREVASILRSAAPWFTAPLYIGMAINLRARLKQHRNKIVELRDQQAGYSGEDMLEAGFAKQVVARKFDPTNLFVHYAEVDVDTGEHNDLENILNRINYPIFGRN